MRINYAPGLQAISQGIGAVGQAMTARTQYAQQLEMYANETSYLADAKKMEIRLEGMVNQFYTELPVNLNDPQFRGEAMERFREMVNGSWEDNRESMFKDESHADRFSREKLQPLMEAAEWSLKSEVYKHEVSTNLANIEEGNNSLISMVSQGADPVSVRSRLEDDTKSLQGVLSEEQISTQLSQYAEQMNVRYAQYQLSELSHDGYTQSQIMQIMRMVNTGNTDDTDLGKIAKGIRSGMWVDDPELRLFSVDEMTDITSMSVSQTNIVRGEFEGAISDAMTGFMTQYNESKEDITLGQFNDMWNSHSILQNNKHDPRINTQYTEFKNQVKDNEDTRAYNSLVSEAVSGVKTLDTLEGAETFIDDLLKDERFNDLFHDPNTGQEARGAVLRSAQSMYDAILHGDIVDSYREMHEKDKDLILTDDMLNADNRFLNFYDDDTAKRTKDLLRTQVYLGKMKGQAIKDIISDQQEVNAFAAREKAMQTGILLDDRMRFIDSYEHTGMITTEQANQARALANRVGTSKAVRQGMTHLSGMAAAAIKYDPDKATFEDTMKFERLERMFHDIFSQELMASDEKTFSQDFVDTIIDSMMGLTTPEIMGRLGRTYDMYGKDRDILTEYLQENPTVGWSRTNSELAGKLEEGHRQIFEQMYGKDISDQMGSTQTRGNPQFTVNAALSKKMMEQLGQGVPEGVDAISGYSQKDLLIDVQLNIDEDGEYYPIFYITEKVEDEDGNAMLDTDGNQVLKGYWVDVREPLEPKGRTGKPDTFTEKIQWDLYSTFDVLHDAREVGQIIDSYASHHNIPREVVIEAAIADTANTGKIPHVYDELMRLKNQEPIPEYGYSTGAREGAVPWRPTEPTVQPTEEDGTRDDTGDDDVFDEPEEFQLMDIDESNKILRAMTTTSREILQPVVSNWIDQNPDQLPTEQDIDPKGEGGKIRSTNLSQVLAMVSYILRSRGN